MAEENETPPERNNVPTKGNLLTKKVGPFPGFVWLGIAGVPIAAYIFLHKSSASTAATAQAVPTASDIPPTAGGSSGGGGDGGGSTNPPVDLTPILNAMQTNSASELASLQALTQGQQQASTSLMTTLGSMMQAIANLKVTPTSNATPPYTTTAPSYPVPSIQQPQPPQYLPPSLPIPQIYPQQPMYHPSYPTYGMPGYSGGTPNAVAPFGYGVYSPGGSFQPITPAPGYNRTTYFGGDGSVIYGGVPA